MKTIREALIDEIIYPIPDGLVENKLIARQLSGDGEYTFDVSKSSSYKGCFADCLVALVQAINFSEADKSIGTMSDEVKKMLLRKANSIYTQLGEDAVTIAESNVYINC